MANDYGATENGGDGLGSLADELAEAWDEDGEGEEDVSGLQTEGYEGSFGGAVGSPGEQDTRINNDKGVDVVSSPVPEPVTNGPSSPVKLSARSKHARSTSRYDGSEYGEEMDHDETSRLPPSLEARMATIESLARQGTAENGGEADGVIGRVIDGLKDLGSQSGVENCATRYAIPIPTHTLIMI